MIKIRTRHNLLYPLMFIIFNSSRKIVSIVMKNNFNLSGSILLTFIMFFADFISGLLVYIYHLKYLRRKRATKFMGIELIQAPSEITPLDNDFKICLLLFFTSYLDFAEYILSSYYIPYKFNKVSISLEWRLKSIIICASSIFSYFILNIPIFKHQKLSIITILFCLIIVIITEMIEYYDKQNQSEGSMYIIFVLILFIINQNFSSGFDVIEKYLLEVDHINPFKLLMLEGLIGFILSLLFSIYQNPFEEINKVKDKMPQKMPLLILFLILFFFLSCGRNIYRITTNKLYSPTTKALSDYIYVPIFIIYYFIWENDFSAKDKKIYYYFIVNLIISFIVVFCSLLYNEFIILYFCNLHYDTHYEVAIRAKKIENKPFELSFNDNEESVGESTFSEIQD